MSNAVKTTMDVLMMMDTKQMIEMFKDMDMKDVVKIHTALTDYFIEVMEGHMALTRKDEDYYEREQFYDDSEVSDEQDAIDVDNARRARELR
jgi:kynureninase